MNELESYVTKISKPCHRVTEGEDSWWEVEVEYQCYGPPTKKRVFKFIKKADAEKLGVGYTWNE